MRRFTLFIAGLAAVLAATSSDAGQLAPERWVVRDLGSLGGNESDADAINDQGQIVGSSKTKRGSYVMHAFVWQNGTMRDLGTLGGTGSSSWAHDINARGQIVGEAEAGGTKTHAFLWAKGVMRDLGTLGGRDSRALAINDRGQIVGESMVEGGTFHAFLWENGQMSDLGTFGGKRSHAMAINDPGQIVGKKCSPSWLGKCRTFLWQDGKTISLEGLPARAIAADLNDRGEVVGYIDTGKRDDEEGDPISHAFIWRDGKLRDLGVLSQEDDNSWAEAINDRGQVVGESWDVLPHGGAGGRAFMWERGIMSALRPLPAFSERCEGLDVNGRGSVVGSCTDFFHDRGVLWTLKR